MDYMATFHGVTQQTLEALREGVRRQGFAVPDGGEGVASSNDVSVAYRYRSDSETLDISIRQKPADTSAGHILGVIADALGPEHHLAFAS